MDVIIDGYNLIGADQGLRGALERKRDWLTSQLAAYQRRKQFNLIVVFDGWRSGQTHETIKKRDGIMIVYSRVSEKADAVIVRIAREKGSGCVVVTSDREIRKSVERFGAVAIYAGEFNEILRSLDGAPEEDSFEESELPPANTGNPNRLSKSERKRQEKLTKLRM